MPPAVVAGMRAVRAAVAASPAGRAHRPAAARRMAACGASSTVRRGGGGEAPVEREKWAALLAESHLRVVGRPLLPDLTADFLARADAADVEARIEAWGGCVLSHDLPADAPRFNYANPAGMRAFEMPDEETLCATESRKSAPDTGTREERAELLHRVTTQGFIDDYRGVRVSTTGRLFRLEGATVWNVRTSDGEVVGQAAAFERTTPVASADV